MFDGLFEAGHVKAVIGESVEVENEEDGEVGSSGEVGTGEGDLVESPEHQLYEKRPGGELKNDAERDRVASAERSRTGASPLTRTLLRVALRAISAQRDSVMRKSQLDARSAGN